jgi:site-specific recombinase XerD
MSNAIIVSQTGTDIVSIGQQNAIEKIASMVLDTVSARSQRDYGRALTDFMN